MANKNRPDIHDTLLQLIRLGIGKETVSSFRFQVPNTIDWERLKGLADRQGLSAVVLDGIERLNTNESSSLLIAMKMMWIGEVLQNYEQRYRQYESALSSLASFYSQHGYRMMVLKGYACSLDWPKPYHRPCGDIDIWQFGSFKEADAALNMEYDIKIDNGHHHHTVFEWQGFSVENHYDFLNVHHHRSNVEMEHILKELGQDDSHYTEVNGERVYLPSANLHALFLLRHSMSNFAAAEMTLRQLLDWAFLVEKHGKAIDWIWLEEMLEKYGMGRLYNIFNAICVEDLGFKVGLFPNYQFDPVLKERVLSDILSPEFSEKEKGGFVSRAAYKYRRWRANAWKHELCFKESMWSAFLSGVWNHLLKPSSI